MNRTDSSKPDQAVIVDHGIFLFGIEDPGSVNILQVQEKISPKAVALPPALSNILPKVSGNHLHDFPQYNKAYYLTI